MGGVSGGGAIREGGALWEEWHLGGGGGGGGGGGALWEGRAATEGGKGICMGNSKGHYAGGGSQRDVYKSSISEPFVFSIGRELHW